MLLASADTEVCSHSAAGKGVVRFVASGPRRSEMEIISIFLEVSTVQSTQPRTHAAGIRKVSDKHSGQMQKAEATVHENSVKSLLLFVLHKRKKEKKSLHHLPFLTAA